ncbi:MAG: hypothetical protein Q9195_002226 [Heterodermia aff. obscurata]
MEERASIQPGLPRANPTVSYWQDPPASISNLRTSPVLPGDVDYVIVGSGITGTTIAHTILQEEHPPSVLMLEARTACSGATGRNGGHTKHASYRSFLDNLLALGEEEAARIATFEYRCMKAVHAFARDHHIECDSWEGDTVDVIYDRWEWNRAKAAAEKMRRVLGDDNPAAKYTFWNADEASNKFMTPDSYGALSYEAGSLSAYKFVIGALNLALDKGLNLQTETPVLKVVKNSATNGWAVETSRGSVRTKKVILATNGYSAHLYPALQGIIVPLRGHMTAQRQGLGMPSDGLSTTYSFVYDNGYEYMIQRPRGSTFEGDIMIGGGSTVLPEAGLCEFGTTDDTTIEPVVLDYLRNSTARYFGQHWGQDHAEGRIRQAWTGIMGYSSDGFPLVGELPGERGLYIAASFHGHGMVLSFLTAKAVLSMVNQLDDDNLRSFPMSFRITEERMGRKFCGRLHTKTPMDLELKSQE